MIVEGKLRPKQRIPSTRTLSKELGVSRFPVLSAYGQLLTEGYLQGRVGAGTVVSDRLPDHLIFSAPSQGIEITKGSATRRLSKIATTLPPFRRSPWFAGWGPFGVGQVSVEDFPHKVWSTLMTRYGRSTDSALFRYCDTRGSRPLRERLANYLRSARSVTCEADQIVIVSGSQQALEITARMLIDKDDSVWFEDPGYTLARDAFSLTGCRLIAVPIDAEGMDVSVGMELCNDARGVFVTPSHQFPLGMTMSASRRLQLLQWAHMNGAWIIEDDYDSEFRYDCEPIASLQGLDGGSRVIYIGTFSKVLFPSLRLGYVVLPEDLVDRFLVLRRAADISPSTLYQDVLADFISEGHFARHIRRMRGLYEERRNVLVNCLVEELGSEVEIVGSEAGMHLTVILKTQHNDVAIAEEAARGGVWTWPLSRCYLSNDSKRGFILGFGSSAPEEIPVAIRKLRKLLRG